MIAVPIASFLAGSLLSLILPVAILIALVTWYGLSLHRPPARTDAPEVDRAVSTPAQPPSGAPEPPPPAGGA